METLQNQPQINTITVNSDWMEKTKTAVHVRQFQPFHIDQPEQMGGDNSAPNPMEYMLGSLLGCESTMIAGVAQKMKFQFEDIQMEVAGDIDMRGIQGNPKVKPYFQNIRQVVKVKTSEPDERLNELKSKVEATCPAYNLMKDAGVNMHVDWQRMS